MSYQEQFDNCKSVDEILSLMVTLSGEVTNEEELQDIKLISREAVKKLQTAHKETINVTSIRPTKVIVEAKTSTELPYVALQLYSDYKSAQRLSIKETIGSNSIILEA